MRMSFLGPPLPLAARAATAAEVLKAFRGIWEVIDEGIEEKAGTRARKSGVILFIVCVFAVLGRRYGLGEFRREVTCAGLCRAVQAGVIRASCDVI